MKVFSIGMLLLAALQVTSVIAADSTVTAPACGLKCIVTATAEHSNCSLTDVACICLNKELNLAAAACIAESCSVRDQLATQKYSKVTCGVESQDRTALIWIVGIVFGILGLIAFGLRVTARVFVGSHKSWGPDDWVMTIAVVGAQLYATVCAARKLTPTGVDDNSCSSIRPSITTLYVDQWADLVRTVAHYGLGKDMWMVEPDDITNILYLYFWDELVYLAVLPVTKISILLFYLKIFPKREFKIAVWVLIGFNLAYLVTFEIVSIWQCRPIQGAWLAWDGTFEATCNDINMQGWMSAALNLVLDLGTIILPLPELASLSMSLRKKIQILSMFCVGFFVTIVSALRLQSLAKYANTSNVTQDYVEVGYWSTIEVPVGVVCACMPAIRSLIATIFPKVFGTTQQKSNYTGVSGGSKQWSFARLNSSGKHIKVQTEWIVRSHNVPEHEESRVELVPVPSPSDLQSPLPTRPPSDLAMMQTSCERAEQVKHS
ncbi:hypothetical protein KVR01_006021 [Diaporthe batatas]|uniref:uncharacterized protein n=1 Tax=Diaporthe batatas TaxID=748121 RepID=UPI001D03C16D|nr:uncharacterized protein KVR01_006021 [Diaporthe batatas]KAG8164103.1 hypothetical protein KVR01_006021 [Diaporthe batatas]